MLTFNPHKRILVEDALAHPYLEQEHTDIDRNRYKGVRWAYPTHNDTLETFVREKKDKIILVILFEK